jgi:hypothetical protein
MRRAGDAASLLANAAPETLALASVSPGEWQSAGWRVARNRHFAGGGALWTTANQGTQRLLLRADGPVVRGISQRWRPGIWSNAASACPAP